MLADENRSPRLDLDRMGSWPVTALYFGRYAGELTMSHAGFQSMSRTFKAPVVPQTMPPIRPAGMWRRLQAWFMAPHQAPQTEADLWWKANGP